MAVTTFDPLSRRVIGCAIEVHRAVGPGLLESAYQQCLARELSEAGIPFKMEAPVPLRYKGALMDCAFRADFVIDDKLIVELKCVDHLLKIHEAQLLAYMRLAKCGVGLLINFNVPLLRLEGIRRFVL